MHNIAEFVDERLKAWCIHCGEWLANASTNRDHVPSKTLLNSPYPNNLPTIQVCTRCNASFAHDEEYLVAFLGAALSGTTDLAEQSFESARRVLRGNHKLREKVDRSKTVYRTRGEMMHVVWKPDVGAIRRVIIKNARGHVFFEYGQPMMERPDAVWVAPVLNMTTSERDVFHAPTEMSLMGWPEVGSRMMTRLITGQDVCDEWIVVQDGIYRYKVEQTEGFRVRTIIHEYLATEVSWRCE